MKKNIILLFILFQCVIYGQSKANPLIIIDAQKKGFMNDFKKEMEELNPNDISTISVFKDSISKKYGSDSGIIVITTKKFILDTFYKNNIENSSLKEFIASSDDLLKIGIVIEDLKITNHPYDQLSKYIDTFTINEKIEKIAKIIFIKPEDALKINPKWVNGAIEIVSEMNKF